MTRKRHPQPEKDPASTPDPHASAVAADPVEAQTAGSGAELAASAWSVQREGSIQRPYITRRRLERKLERRNLILSAAKTLFSREPYAGVSFRRIELALDLPRGAVGYHFENKEALWRAVTGTAPPLDRLTARHHIEVETVLRQVLQAHATGDETAIETSLLAARSLVKRLPPRVA
ncbi:MAG: helix-turn-helix transcriptional regulator [Brevundimonas sp.]|jgi:hypothetical protein|nr:helix-turn-helix transcriptional regulator [Brevundimonas sp.]